LGIIDNVGTPTKNGKDVAEIGGTGHLDVFNCIDEAKT
jgi:hypothetical protein